MKMDRFNMKKGVTDLIPYVILVLIVLGLILIYYIRTEIGQMDIHVMILEAGAERRVLNLGQALLSYDKLVYIEEVEAGDRANIHRGIFESGKIDIQFKEDSDLTAEFGYPDTFIAIYLKDVETGEDWMLSFNGPFDKALGSEDVMTCIMSKTKIDISMLFRWPSGSPWEIPDIVSCLTSEFSSYGTAVRYFPVAIRYEDSSGVHVNQGVLKVAIYEWWLVTGVA